MARTVRKPCPPRVGPAENENTVEAHGAGRTPPPPPNITPLHSIVVGGQYVDSDDTYPPQAVPLALDLDDWSLEWETDPVMNFFGGHATEVCFSFRFPHNPSSPSSPGRNSISMARAFLLDTPKQIPAQSTFSHGEVWWRRSAATGNNSRSGRLSMMWLPQPVDPG